MKTKVLFLITLALLAAAVLTSCTPTEPDADATITGSVQWQGRGIEMAWVEVYTRAEQDRTTPPVAETASGEEGKFSITLPPGRYWVWAKATLDENDRERRLVGEAAPNPVEPGPGQEATVLVTLEDPSGFKASTGPTGAGVKGKVTGLEADAPVNIYVYKGAADKPVGPGFVATAPLNDDSSFKIDLAPDRYTLTARLRASGLDYGSPEVGDRISVSRFEVIADQYIDLGELALKELNPEEWLATTATLSQGTATVTGRVTDAQKAPVKGVRVLAFTDPRMAGKPAAISPATNEEGTFILSLPGDGRYFLGARTKVGGPASPGEKIGSYRGPDGDGLKVDKGALIEGIEIEVEEIW